MTHAIRTLRQTGAVGALVAVLALGGAPAALALEPTPQDPADTPPAVTPPPELGPARVIVKYRASEAPRLATPQASRNAAALLSDVAGAEVEHIREMSGNAQVVRITGLVIPQNADPREVLQSVVDRIAADPAVEYAEIDGFNYIQQAVDDARFSEQWHYSEPASGVGAAAAWENATGADVVVAVLDTGVRPHPDLAANLLPGFDFVSDAQIANDGDLRDADPSDPGDWVGAVDAWCPLTPRDSSWHGTHVAGTVAAVTNNAEGVAGVARDAKVVPIRVLGKCGGFTSDIVDGMRWAAGLAVPGAPLNANAAQVLNLSLGGPGGCSATYQDAIDDILLRNATIVVAAGNSNENAANFRPASCDGVIAVAATTRAGGRAYYSNFGPAVEIAAPGGETFQVDEDGVLSTLNEGTEGPGADSYAFYQGTSMAAPHVAAVAALLYERDPLTTPSEVLSRLQTTAKPFPAVSPRPCTTSNCGAGIVDAAAATAPIPPQGGAPDLSFLRLLLPN